MGINLREWSGRDPDAASLFNTLPEEVKSDPEMTESIQGDPRSWFTTTKTYCVTHLSKSPSTKTLGTSKLRTHSAQTHGLIQPEPALTR